ncbi:hypothetical protein [Staphylococcus gallinarum]|uniref:hypothetical protein n=1 Tax=Staphylococcus gallinarum TaxID=1293 RepID=UPI001E3EF8FD|nr:hypothetical protein [Staphylococcus gallinarum]UEH02037.1 hypothetical protein K3U27_06720 [Staphylococcus gallinarum]
MKIKTKKQLNLPQLIEWAQDNIEEATKKVYRVDESEILGSHVRFTEVYSDLEIRLHGYIPFDTTFTVEVEEDVTEDTVIPKMLEMYRDTTSNLGAEIYINQSINSVIENAGVLTLHIVNDDGTHTLIWRDGKLVE